MSIAAQTGIRPSPSEARDLSYVAISSKENSTSPVKPSDFYIPEVQEVYIAPVINPPSPTPMIIASKSSFEVFTYPPLR